VDSAGFTLVELLVVSAIISLIMGPNAGVGSGSTAAAVRQELATGQPVGPAFHSQKAADSVQALERWLSNNPTAQPGDRVRRKTLSEI
jgi:prepilin-type N-terminal cleavage/methylation domain-containing protein